MDILEMEALEKSFHDRPVLRGVELSVPEHSIFGFVGQNGAGKTTTMKLILGLLRPDGGSITVCGEPVSCGEARTNRYIGYLPDAPEFYGYMNPQEYLALCGEITGLSREETRGRTEELLQLVGLSQSARKKTGGFSRGMRQRLGIAQALLNRPRLLICDEPTSALDPIGRKEILDILSTVRTETTVLFSTHILSDVERVCDRVAVLHDGKIALSGTISEIKESHRQDSYRIEFASPQAVEAFLAEQPVRQLAAQPGYLAQPDGSILTVKVPDIHIGGMLLLGLLASQGIVPLKFELLEPTLESLFLEVAV